MKDVYEIESDFPTEKFSRNKNDKRIRGTYLINGGGAKIILKSTNGNIEIKKGR